MLIHAVLDHSLLETAYLSGRRRIYTPGAFDYAITWYQAPAPAWVDRKPNFHTCRFLKPMHRIAVVSDLHANLPALNAVLEDLNKRQPDAVFCLGDLVDFAPWPNEAIETIRQRRIPTLMGNHDERIAFNHAIIPLEKHTEQERAARVGAIEYTRRTISADNREFLSGLPREMRISYGTGSNAKKILLVHASARSIDEYVYEDHPEIDLIKMLRKTMRM
jgi:predicted phosphodiesterase